MCRSGGEGLGYPEPYRSSEPGVLVSMGGTAGAQVVSRMEPILVRRSVRTTSRLPEFTSQDGDIFMSEGGDAMPHRNCLRMLMSLLGVLQCLPRVLLPRQVILLSVLFGNAMHVRGLVVQFGGQLVVFVVRSVVIACRHFKDSPSALTCCGRPGQACKRDPNTPAPVPRASVPLRHSLFRCVRRPYDARAPLVRAARRQTRARCAWP